MHPRTQLGSPAIVSARPPIYLLWVDFLRRRLNECLRVCLLLWEKNQLPAMTHSLIVSMHTKCSQNIVYLYTPYRTDIQNIHFTISITSLRHVSVCQPPLLQNWLKCIQNNRWQLSMKQCGLSFLCSKECAQRTMCLWLPDKVRQTILCSRRYAPCVVINSASNRICTLEVKAWTIFNVIRIIYIGSLSLQ